MSVNVNARRDNKAIYIKKARDLHITTIHNVKKLKNTYKFEITDDLLKCSKNISYYAAKADSIYLGKFTSKDIFFSRKRALQEALGNAKAMRIDLEILWKLMQQGDDRFGPAKERDETFLKWANELNEVTALITKIIQSDEDRWRTWQPRRKDKKNNDNQGVDVQEVRTAITSQENNSDNAENSTENEKENILNNPAAITVGETNIVTDTN